jgi:hypothetical protein
VARIYGYGYGLGGKNHFAADRAVAEKRRGVAADVMICRTWRGGHRAGDMQG